MKAITIKIAFLIIYSNIYSQFNIEINTPKGTDVAAKDYVYLYGGDYEDPERASVDNYWLTRSNVNSNEVEIIERSTLSYNCHSYAWHVSEGGVRVWVDDWGSSGDIDNVNRYWDDGSYTETTQTNHRKVFYHPETQFDHSAVTTNQNGWFISKWTDGPLIKHRYDNCPYWNSAVNLKYYKLSSPVISNSTTAICNNTQRTFTSDITDANFNYNWSITSPLTEVSGDGTPSYRVASGSQDGQSALGLSITTPSGVTVSTNKSVWVGVPSTGTTTIAGGYISYPSPFPCIYTYGQRYGVHLNGYIVNIS